MYGPKVSMADLNARVADRVDNCSDSLPFPLPTEPFFIGEFSREPSRIQSSPEERRQRIERRQAVFFAVFLGLLGAWVLFDSMSRR